MGGVSFVSNEFIICLKGGFEFMGFFKTLMNGYKIMFSELNRKHNDLIPRAFTGCGTGLMMIGSAVMAKTAMKDDTDKVISEANAAIDKILKNK